MPMIQIGSIQLQLYRKPVKYLCIRVMPHDGYVRVSAPLRMPTTTIQEFIMSQLSWIREQQNNFAKLPKLLPPEMVAGECHYLWGKPYRLEVVRHNGRHNIKLNNEKLYLYINPNTSLEKRVLALSHYYRAELKNRIETLLPYWKNRMGVAPNFWGIKK